MENRVLTLEIKNINDAQEFLESASNLNGKAKLIRNDMIIPNNSRLGIMALIFDKEPFNMVFDNCSEAEISKFEKFQFNINNTNDLNLNGINIEFSNENYIIK